MKKITFMTAALGVALYSFPLHAQQAFEAANEVEIIELGVPGQTDYIVRAGTLYSNGPIVNVPGGGAGGNDLSLLESATLGMNILGFGHAILVPDIEWQMM